MDFFNIPETKSPELIHDEHMHNQERLLNEIKSLQQEQISLLNKMSSDSNEESKYNRRTNALIVVIALLTLIATLYPLIVSLIG